MPIDVRSLPTNLQDVLSRSGMERVRAFVANYEPDGEFGAMLDPTTPIMEIIERTGHPPFVEILFNIVLRTQERRVVRCTISRRGLFPTVGVVMITTSGRLVLMDEFRPQSGLKFLSVPSGCWEERESLVASALREGRTESLYEATRRTQIYELPAFAYHGAMLSMLETVVVVTHVRRVRQLCLSDAPDSDEWINNRRAVTLGEFYELVRSPPPRTYLHGPALACVGTAQAHGFLPPSQDDLIALVRLRRRLRPKTGE